MNVCFKKMFWDCGDTEAPKPWRCMAWVKRQKDINPPQMKEKTPYFSIFMDRHNTN